MIMVFLGLTWGGNSLDKFNYENLNDLIQFKHSVERSPHVEFHIHWGFEIYFLISGDVNYFVEKKSYSINYGDILITNNHEIHKPFFRSDKTYERITLLFSPEIAGFFSADDFSLLDCFTKRPNGERNKIVPSSVELSQILKIFDTFDQIGKNLRNGNGILKLCCLMELLVILNRHFRAEETEDSQSEYSNLPIRLIPILNYIDKNLEDDLTLDTLSELFYIDKYHLSKMFKKSVGNTLHEYIIWKRIARAKQLLANGQSVKQTCANCGFVDYSNFLKTFKRIVGVTPGDYKKSRYPMEFHANTFEN